MYFHIHMFSTLQIHPVFIVDIIYFHSHMPFTKQITTIFITERKHNKNHSNCFCVQTLSEFNSLYHEVVGRDVNDQNNLEEFIDYIFPYAYQCNEATLAFVYALNKTIAG